MRRATLVLLLLLGSAAVYGQATIKIHGKVMNADSQTVAFAAVRVPGLTATQTDANGYFAFILSKQKAESIFFKPGVDVKIIVAKAGMVMLEPPEQDPTIRLPQNWTYQKPFRICLARKGSLALLRSDRMLEAILRQKIQAAIEVKEEEFSRRDVLAEQAQLLGLDKPALLKAVGEFKDRLRTSADLNLRGLAALDDANEAAEYKARQQKLAEAKENFRKSITKDERAAREGREAEQRLPDTYSNLGLTFFNEVRYDSAVFYFAKADSMKPNDADRLDIWGQALLHLAVYEGALAKFNEALATDERYFGRNHSNVARDLVNVAGVLRAKGDYAETLAKYEEALAITEKCFGRNHPNVVRRLNNIAAVLESKGDYDGALARYNEALGIDEKYFGRNHPNVVRELNNIAVVLNKQGQFKQAVAKLDSALAICEKLLGPDHPNTQSVRMNRDLAHLASLPTEQRWPLHTKKMLAALSSSSKKLSASDSLDILNQIGRGYIGLGKGDSALYYLQQALPIAKTLQDQEMIGILYNNLGGANKLKQDWPQAQQWLEKSLHHNRAIAGDSAAVLASTYFHLAGVAQAEGQTNLSREYAQKSLALAERHKLTDLRVEVEALLKQKKIKKEK